MFAVLSVCLASLALELKRNQIAKPHKKLYAPGCNLLEIKKFGEMTTFRERFSKPFIANTMPVTGVLASISTTTIRRNESVSLLLFISCFSVKVVSC